MKLLGQFLLMILIFVGAWLGLSQLNLMEILKIEDEEQSMEMKLGKRLEKEILRSETVLSDTLVNRYIDDIFEKICEANKLDSEDYSLTLLNSTTVNAFAIPGNCMMVYSGLILNSEYPEEIAGVLAHELAHIQEKHVMKKLTRELGITIISGAAGGGSMTEITHVVTSRGFDRELESQADATAVHYLEKAKINPEGLANFLYRMSLEEGAQNGMTKLMRTHPGGETRALDITNLIDTTLSFETLYLDEDWQEMKDYLRQTY